MKMPPPVEECLFKLRDVTLSTTNDVSSTHFYFCRMQTNAFLAKESDSIIGASSRHINANENARGFYDQSYWYKDSKETKISNQDDPFSKPNDVHSLVLAVMQNKLSSAFNMGVPNVKIGGLQWHGNTFSALTYRGRRITGEIVTNMAGIPELNIELQLNATNVSRITVKYNFASTDLAPIWMPTKIETWVHFSNSDRLSSEIEVVSMKPKTKPFTRGDFAPDIFDNHTAKYRTEFLDGKEHRSQVVEERRARISTIFISVLSLLTLVGVYLIVKYSKSHEKNVRR